MKKTSEYIKEAKEALNIQSDYEMANWLGVTRQAMSSYKIGRTTIDDYAAMRIAEALKIDPIEVICAANFEREKEGKRKEFWRNFGGATVGGFVGLSLLLTGAQSASITAAEKVTDYTLCVRRRKIGKSFLTRFIGFLLRKTNDPKKTLRLLQATL